MVLTASLGEQRVILQNIIWQLFEALLAELGDSRSSRLAYDRGTLEIITPLLPHEQSKRLVENMMMILVEELNLTVKSLGSMTGKREDLERGIEPDSGFYIQNEPLVRTKKQINLNQDPPPDLVLAVNFSSSSLDKTSIYFALGVPEIWRYAEGELQIMLLRGQYILSSTSPTFANLPLTEIPQFLAQSNQVGEAQILRQFRSWVKEQL